MVHMLASYPATSLPCQHYMMQHVTIWMRHVSPYGHATCHPCYGDMCHFPVGPPVPSMSLVRTLSQPTTSAA
jgi:hypothetical protein